MEAEGIISKVIDGQGFHVFVHFPDTCLLDKRQIDTVTVGIQDKRKITAKQRNTIFALCGFISDWAKAPIASKRKLAKQETLREFGIMYVFDKMDAFNREALREAITTHYCILVDSMPFSLSDTDMTTAHDFIGWIIDLCVENAVPIPACLMDYAEDVGRYLYSCVAHRHCAICGKKADIHHSEETVGMGSDRNKTHHLGMWVQPLCRMHHREAEQIGRDDFNRKYHMQSIRLDENLCEILGWRK